MPALSNAKKPRWQGSHPVMFHKRDVTLRTRFRWFGRIDHNETWKIVGIKTWSRSPLGDLWVQRKVPAAVKYNDDITIENERTGERRTMQLSGMVYSSGWHLI